MKMEKGPPCSEVVINHSKLTVPLQTVIFIEVEIVMSVVGVQAPQPEPSPVHRSMRTHAVTSNVSLQQHSPLYGRANERPTKPATSIR